MKKHGEWMNGGGRIYLSIRVSANTNWDNVKCSALCRNAYIDNKNFDAGDAWKPSEMGVFCIVYYWFL